MAEPSLLFVVGMDPEVFAGSIEGAAKQLQQTSSRFQRVGESIMDMLTAPISRLAVRIQEAGLVKESAMHSIALATGASGAVLASLTESVMQTRSAMGGDIGSISLAVSSLYRDLGLVGPAMTQAAMDMSLFARAVGSEMQPAVLAVIGTLRAWGMSATDLRPLMASIRDVMVGTRMSVGQVSQQLALLAPIMRQSGMSLEATTGMLTQLVRLGVEPQQVFTGFQQAATRLALQGSSIEDGLRTAIAAIQSASSPTDAARQAVALFGESGIRVSEAIQRGGLTAADTMSGGWESLLVTAETVRRLSRGGDRLRAQMEESASVIWKPLKPVMMLAVSALEMGIGAIRVVVGAFAKLPEIVQDTIIVVAGIAAAAAGVLIAIGSLAGLLAKAVKLLLKKAFGTRLKTIMADYLAGVLVVAAAGSALAVATMAPVATLDNVARAAEDLPRSTAHQLSEVPKHVAEAATLDDREYYKGPVWPVPDPVAVKPFRTPPVLATRLEPRPEKISLPHAPEQALVPVALPAQPAMMIQFFADPPYSKLAIWMQQQYGAEAAAAYMGPYSWLHIWLTAMNRTEQMARETASWRIGEPARAQGPAVPEWMQTLPPEYLRHTLPEYMRLSARPIATSTDTGWLMVSMGGQTDSPADLLLSGDSVVDSVVESVRSQLGDSWSVALPDDPDFQRQLGRDIASGDFDYFELEDGTRVRLNLPDDPAFRQQLLKDLSEGAVDSIDVEGSR